LGADKYDDNDSDLAISEDFFETTTQRNAMSDSVKSAQEARAAGLKVLSELGWPADSGFPDLDPAFWDFTTKHLFGQVWARPGLALRDRALVTLAVLLALDADPGCMNHLRYAHNLGITEEEIRELIIQVQFYAGWPKGSHAMLRFASVLKEPGNGWVAKRKAKEEAL
jgi:alkylhydroperoxidase/carboxymuconolactone decarboxylase family protein YurZ